jgi:Na+/phosphate symporter
MISTIRSIIVWVLALAGVALFGWFVVASGGASLDAKVPPTLKPPELESFGLAAGVLLATNLGGFLGIVIKTGGGGLAALKANQQQPWAPLVGSLAYLALLAIAVYYYIQSDFNPNGAEVITKSLATAAGVVLGAMTTLFNAKE